MVLRHGLPRPHFLVILLHAASAVRRSAPWACALSWLVLVLVGAMTSASAQGRDGTAGSVVAGAVLGLTAGASVGNFGMILPCTQTALGASCVAGATIGGGAIGLTSGIVVGSSDGDLVIDRAASGLVGFGIGIVVALTGRPFFQRVGVEDVFAVGIVGGALGTQPRGAGIGAAVGAGLGLVAWPVVPGFERPDVIATVLAGAMIGVLAGWVGDAVDTRSQDQRSVPLFTARLPL